MLVPSFSSGPANHSSSIKSISSLLLCKIGRKIPHFIHGVVMLLAGNVPHCPLFPAIQFHLPQTIGAVAAKNEFFSLSIPAVTRMPHSTSLSAFCTRKPVRRKASIKLAADGSTTTTSGLRPSSRRHNSSTYSASVFVSLPGGKRSSIRRCGTILSPSAPQPEKKPDLLSRNPPIPHMLRTARPQVPRSASPDQKKSYTSP